jgi:hypothetical protein
MIVGSLFTCDSCLLGCVIEVTFCAGPDLSAFLSWASFLNEREFSQAIGSTVRMSETTKMKKNIEYVAPPADVLEDFAHQACQGVGGEYADPEVERGFADFLVLISRILAKNLTRDPSLLAELMPESSGCKSNQLE